MEGVRPQEPGRGRAIALALSHRPDVAQPGDRASAVRAAGEPRAGCPWAPRWLSRQADPAGLPPPALRPVALGLAGAAGRSGREAALCSPASAVRSSFSVLDTAALRPGWDWRSWHTRTHVCSHSRQQPRRPHAWPGPLRVSPPPSTAQRGTRSRSPLGVLRTPGLGQGQRCSQPVQHAQG